MATATSSSLGTAEDDDVARLWAEVDPMFLRLLGWEEDRKVLVFPQDHPLLGWVACVVAGCHKDAKLAGHGLCQTCFARWRTTGSQPLAEFVVEPKPLQRSIGVSLCMVDGCRRPWKSSKLKLCVAHDWQRQRTLGVSLEVFLARQDMVGYPPFGPCSVAACTHDRVGQGPYCHTHQQRLAAEARRTPGLDPELWSLTAPAVSENGDVSLRGLHSRVVAEVIYGLQARTNSGVKTRYWNLRPLCDRVRTLQATSLEEVPTDGLAVNHRKVFAVLLRELRRFRANPETERHKDVWDLAAFGHAGTLRFTGLSQPWLREAAKRWVLDDMPKRRGQQVGNVIRARLNALGMLSESLRLHRADHGNLPVALSRQDITAFCNRLAYLTDQGTISANQRLQCSRQVRHVLNGIRALGMTRPDQPLHDLPEDFALTVADLPDEPEDTELGRDLPVEVMRHLCDHLPELDEISRLEIRVAVELMIDTGRRPAEVCGLGLNCVDRDPDGKPVLVYDYYKANRMGRRLPIAEATAGLIVTQQQRVRGRFPTAPAATLKLLPSPARNPEGTRAITEGWVSKRHRDWVHGLPEVLVPMVVEENGKAVTKLLPFDKAKIFPNAYRHTYAQRHADAGVDVTVLSELMSHRQLTTTQGYYTVGQERRREAVDRVTAMQFDRHGTRIWRTAKDLLDSEHARRAVGEVAVPYGGCSEPSNVAAGGQDCPLRFRCIGCGHFSTDISYLPDLEHYLADLLRHRERLRATLDADEWAKTEAMPSDDEINRVRRLIDRMNGDLHDLTDEDRAQIEEAVATVRQGRRKVTALGLPRFGPPLPDVRPRRSA